MFKVGDMVRIGTEWKGYTPGTVGVVEQFDDKDSVATCKVKFSSQAPAVWCFSADLELDNNSGDASSSGAVKHDQGKPDLTFVSYDFISGMADVRAFGAQKYSRNGWLDGFKILRSLAAALRHIFQFIWVSSWDDESGKCHLLHAACSLEHAYNDFLHHPENDDRLESVKEKPANA